MKEWRYLCAYSLPVITFVSIYFGGLLSFTTVAEAFVLIPLIELLSSPDKRGPTKEEEGALLSNRIYDALLWAMVPVQFTVLGYFLLRLSWGGLETYELIGMILSMGIQCGAIGINVAHELGHRSTFFERTLARLLLMSSLYMHFIVEHNRGHHTHVATPKDPATARRGESVYRFWIRTIIGSFISAWRIERRRLQQKGRPWWHPSNEMLQLIAVEAGLLLFIDLLFGEHALIGFVGAAFIGILLLETVNYIEHYGLLRKQNDDGKYERVRPWHSWNSDYPLGRIMLFELTRHSDHHYKASKKYQLLNHMEESPQLPTGYPGMMLLSLAPPLWFRTVDPQLDELNRSRR